MGCDHDADHHSDNQYSHDDSGSGGILAGEQAAFNWAKVPDMQKVATFFDLVSCVPPWRLISDGTAPARRSQQGIR